MRWIVVALLAAVLAAGTAALFDAPAQPPGNCGRNQVACDFGGCPDPECGPCEFVWTHPCKPWIKSCRTIPGGCEAGITSLTPR